jgi:hypothetical protein
VPRLSQTRAYVALFLIASLSGTFPATSKLALADLPPTLLTAIRCAIADVGRERGDLAGDGRR